MLLNLKLSAEPLAPIDNVPWRREV